MFFFTLIRCIPAPIAKKGSPAKSFVKTVRIRIQFIFFFRDLQLKNISLDPNQFIYSTTLTGHLFLSGLKICNSPSLLSLQCQYYPPFVGRNIFYPRHLSLLWGLSDGAETTPSPKPINTVHCHSKWSEAE